jgi:hypothetical protein
MKISVLIYALLASAMLVTCRKELTPPPLKNNSGMPNVRISNGHLEFASVSDYEKLFDLSSERRKQFLANFKNNPAFTSYFEAKQIWSNENSERTILGCEVPDEVIEDNEDFFDLLDENGVVQIDSHYLRLDYCNEKVWVLSALPALNDQDYYDFLQGDTTNPKVGWFYTYVDVLEALAHHYTTMPDTNSVGENEIFERFELFGPVLHEWKYFYDNTDEESNPDNTRMDGKLAYDKFGFYFHFYGKEKYQRHGWLGWGNVNNGTRNWLVDYQYQYRRKGQNSDQSGNGTLQAPLSGKNKVEKTFYSGSRGLKRFYAKWDVRNYTKYHAVYRKPSGSFQVLIGTFQNSPSNVPVNVYNYYFNQIVNYGSPNYYQLSRGY